MIKKQCYVMLVEINNLIKNPSILSSKLKRIEMRGLVDRIGKIFQGVFGTAVDSDV